MANIVTFNPSSVHRQKFMVSLDPAMVARVRAESATTKLPMSRVVELALERYFLERYGEPVEQWRSGHGEADDDRRGE